MRRGLPKMKGVPSKGYRGCMGFYAGVYKDV